jgi:glycine betaine/proline transport system substrate-binding protein
MSVLHKLSRRTRFIVIVTLVMVFMGVALTGCGNSSQSPSDKPQFVMADISWDSVKVHNRIAGFIIKHGYGYPEPRYVFGETLPLLQGMTTGEVDITLEVWKDNYEEVWNNALAGGTVLDLGSNYPDAPQGWYVPTYMIKGDPARGIEAVAPDLKSVADLPKYWHLFKDPEVPSKGRFHNSPPGWGVTEINETKLKTYGLTDTFNIFSTGSDTALATSMVTAYDRGQPWVGYYWEPTWIMGLMDMTMLEEPPYDPAVYNDPSNRGCAYPAAKVLKAIHIDVQTNAPEIAEFIKKYQTSLEENNDFLAYMNDNQVESEAAAIYFLKKYPDTWKAWVPADIAQKVTEALKEVK